MKIYNQSKLIKQYPWDVLIVLDACRYDYFSASLSNTMLCGTLIKADSNSKNTERWYYEHWSRKNEDTILISANPHSKLSGCYKNFFMAVEVWEEDNWVYPEPALDVLLDLQKEYDGKKFVVHLIPPHLPFIGKEGKKFLEKLGAYGNEYNVYRTVEKYARKNGWDEIIKYYCESIIEVLNRIEKYIPKMKGNIIITADHGEIIGENNCYMHNIRSDEILIIPWMVIER